MFPGIRWTALERILDTLEGFLYCLISPVLLCKVRPPQVQLFGLHANYWQSHTTHAGATALEYGFAE